MILFFIWLVYIGYLVICAELLRNGHFGWAVFLLVMGISYVFEKTMKENHEELSWIAKALMDETERKACKAEHYLYWIAIECTASKGKIKKGMFVQEIAKVLLQELKDKGVLTTLDLTVSNLEWISEQRITNAAEDNSIKNTILTYHNYGQGIPTPVVKLKFKNWELVKVISGSRSLV